MDFQVTGIRGKNSVNFQASIRSGERLALMGRSGAGKTTLLRALAGFEPSLLIKINDPNNKWASAWQRPVALVHQHPVMFHHHTVQQTFDFATKHARHNYNLPIAQWIEHLSITDIMQKSCAQLSGGQQQRVALLRALLSQPNWLLLDESFSAFDAPLVTAACEVIEEYCDMTDAGLIVASHSEIPLRFLCESALIIENLESQYEKDIMTLLNDSSKDDITTTLTVEPEGITEQFLTANLGNNKIYAPKPTRWKSVTSRISIKAKDISLALGDEHVTSMVNRIEAVIDGVIEHDANRRIVQLGLASDGNESHQILNVDISTWSWQRMNLSVGKKVFAEFKVSAVLWHGHS